MNTFIKSVINLLKYLNINNSKKEFVFYSESKFYREHFIDLIENLLLFNQKNIIFVTSDIEDYNLIKPLVTKDKLYTEYIHYLRNHISSKNIDILTLATEFNEDYFHYLINVLTIDKIKPEFLKVFKNINSELFTKLSKTIDFSNLPKV